MKTPPLTLGTMIRSSRLARGMNRIEDLQKVLSKRGCKVSDRTIGAWELGTRTPRQDKLEALGKALCWDDAQIQLVNSLYTGLAPNGAA